MTPNFASMSIITTSNYKAPFLYRNGHISTVVPSLIGKLKNPGYVRERMELADGDFLDIDWLRKDRNEKVIIISHGLEGSSYRHYVINSARYFYEAGYDIMAWNYRSCSGTMNRLLRLYHHGVTDDLGAVIKQALAVKYKSVYLVGYSMGGSTTLKYLGEQSKNRHSSIKGAATFSVPCNLWNSAEMLLKKSNSIYKKRFLKKLKRKIVAKAGQYPSDMDITGIDKLSTFQELDTRYTAPLHGFESAQHFYDTSTCDLVIPQIQVQSLIVNAKNDPLLGDKCYPYDLVQDHPYVHLETPSHGGHVGFPMSGSKQSWSEVRALEFFESLT